MNVQPGGWAGQVTHGGYTHKGLCRYKEQGLDEPTAIWVDDKSRAEWGRSDSEGETQLYIIYTN